MQKENKKSHAVIEKIVQKIRNETTEDPDEEGLVSLGTIRTRSKQKNGNKQQEFNKKQQHKKRQKERQ